MNESKMTKVQKDVLTNMNCKIWRVLAQILFYHNDSKEIIKPFFENLNNENINDEKYIPLLKTFSKSQIKVLYQNGIISEEKLSIFAVKNNYKTNIEIIISGDKIQELQSLIQKKNIKTFNTITTSFNEVEEMKIPLIQYCIMKNAKECFKYLLVNGYDDPNKIMEDLKRIEIINFNRSAEIIKGYEWDCMATAIYFGNKDIIAILEDRGIEKRTNATRIEAAIL